MEKSNESGSGVVTTAQVGAEFAAWAAAEWDENATVAEWWSRLATAGYSHPMLPVEMGGRGYSRDLAAAVSSALAAAGCVGPPNGLGLMLAAPTIAAHGTPEQRARFIPRILDGSEAWCQLFSEPGAGSDLAGLSARAVLDGDEYVVSGQKVWTSAGAYAQWGMLLARTDPDLPKHQGITFFALDMTQPGVTVRPLREMTGHAMFNEVFLDDVRVPASNVIGGVNNGWAVANTTLSEERASLGSGGEAMGAGSALPGAVAGQLQRRVGEFLGVLQGVGGPTTNIGAVVRQLVALAAANGTAEHPAIRQELARLHSLDCLNTWNTARAQSGQASTGMEANLAKLLSGITTRLSREVACAVLGADAMLWGPTSPTGGEMQEMIVFSPAPSIYGGTDQVQRNIIGERGLGLPREPGDSRTTPFKDLLRNG
jgi:alkylation response protein AidB-like acyl-CoA dehydrogenase